MKGAGGTNPWNLDVGVVLPDQGPGAPGARHLQPHRSRRRRCQAVQLSTQANSFQLGAQAIFF